MLYEGRAEREATLSPSARHRLEGRAPVTQMEPLKENFWPELWPLAEAVSPFKAAFSAESIIEHEAKNKSHAHKRVSFVNSALFFIYSSPFLTGQSHAAGAYTA